MELAREYTRYFLNTLCLSSDSNQDIATHLSNHFPLLVLREHQPLLRPREFIAGYNHVDSIWYCHTALTSCSFNLFTGTQAKNWDSIADIHMQANNDDRAPRRADLAGVMNVTIIINYTPTITRAYCNVCACVYHVVSEYLLSHLVYFVQ
jgi:hypothetical protein